MASEHKIRYEVLNWAKGQPSKAEFRAWNDAMDYAKAEAKKNAEDGIVGAAAFKAIEIRTYEYTSESLAYLFGMDEQPGGDTEGEGIEMTKLSKTMQEAYDRMVRRYRKAQDAGSFEAWYAGSEQAYRERYDGVKFHEYYVADERAEYERALKGIVPMDCTEGTMTALERRGLVEYVGLRRVKLLAV